MTDTYEPTTQDISEVEDGTLTADDFENFWVGCGRNAAVAAFVEWRHKIRPDERAAALVSAWESAEHPERDFAVVEEDTDDFDLALRLWREVGYTVNGQPADLPSEPVRLYRGVSDAVFEEGMSWTDDRETAEWFAHRFGALFGPGMVYTALVEPDGLLARIHNPGSGRGEHEYVVDPGWVEAVEVTA